MDAMMQLRQFAQENNSTKVPGTEGFSQIPPKTHFIVAIALGNALT
jgi:hypothetical protein